MILARPHREEDAHLVPKEPGVYAFLNIEDKLIYIGATGDLRRRFMSWRGVLRRGNRTTRLIVRAAAFARFDGWLFVVLEHDVLFSRAGLLKLEKQAIATAVRLGKYRVLNVQGNKVQPIT